jgi:predicted DNA-binding protein
MITLPVRLEKQFLRIAKCEHTPADKLLEQLVSDYLEDYNDIQIATKALQRIDSGHDALIDWRDVKSELYDVDD